MFPEGFQTDRSTTRGMRCWGLWHYNDCDDVLRPAYGGAASAGSSAEELTAEAFEKLLSDTLRPVQERDGQRKRR